MLIGLLLEADANAIKLSCISLFSQAFAQLVSGLVHSFELLGSAFDASRFDAADADGVDHEIGQRRVGFGRLAPHVDASLLGPVLESLRAAVGPQETEVSVRRMAVKALGVVAPHVDTNLLGPVLDALRAAAGPQEDESDVRSAAADAIINCSARWCLSTSGPWVFRWPDLASGAAPH